MVYKPFASSGLKKWRLQHVMNHSGSRPILYISLAVAAIFKIRIFQLASIFVKKIVPNRLKHQNRFKNHIRGYKWVKYYLYKFFIFIRMGSLFEYAFVTKKSWLVHSYLKCDLVWKSFWLRKHTAILHCHNSYRVRVLWLRHFSHLAKWKARTWRITQTGWIDILPWWWLSLMACYACSSNFRRILKIQISRISELRQYKNGLVSVKIMFVLNLAPFSLNYTAREKGRQFQN